MSKERGWICLRRYTVSFGPAMTEQPDERIAAIRARWAILPPDIDYLLQRCADLTAERDAAQAQRAALRGSIEQVAADIEKCRSYEALVSERWVRTLRAAIASTPADALAVWVPVGVARAALPLVEIQAERCANSAVHERYAEMLERLSFQSHVLYQTAYQGGGDEVFEDSGALSLAHRILSLPDVRQLPAVQRLMEEVQG